ncbi:wax ester/triacylglycerol synthase family O-acyltransferase [Mycobacterium intermedium]|uniref:Diacylglycerol O-acyltransferase n=1 Tax=Mycobacterium intermedium TaxID=28445 RepID=A0A1E3SAZ5_MYCIE|nr:wax ester/triacylglycerol synthase family O-acyltransferase [Mycobacterium intermedium]MCV6967504.1 wax ester/triacylglycerol synthase family O-acyltransferase [Mycobacterium intermedium]ODQ99289.1 diacylglycerol O-acyltransferase [Mycobacterium intermedium]OPE49137.1 diacylglycerol O-acyltransferase [Mycobacterium intermedium]ORB07745.1 wax ester/triacylglycerol synthase family O-acyltransferase [Mycobacterium intermedium]
MKRLSGWDVLMLASETPNVHQHTLKIAIVDTSGFDGAPTFEAFREVFRATLPVLEPMRFQLLKTPWRIHRPVWREDAELDLDYHLQHVRVPAPGGRRELDAVIGAIASTPLDRRHPLWQFYYAEGLADQRVAVIGKVHHVLADGVASANLMARVMAWPAAEASPQSTSPPAESTPDTHPNTREVLRFAARDHAARIRSLPAAVRDGVVGAYRLQRRARERYRHPELAAAFDPAPTFLNHKLTPGRTFASAAVPLADIKAISKKFGVTINDLVLTIATGALRQVLQNHGEPADRPLVASIPTATDTSPDRISGNALSTMLVSLPVQAADPLQRLGLIRTSTRIAKEDHQLLGPTLVSQWLEFVPPGVTRTTFRWMSRREAPNQLFNVIISNVPGPRQRGNIAGAVVTEFYSVGPLAAGSALNITVWSYVDQLSISVLSDDATLNDTHEVTDAFVAAFIELYERAGLAGSTDIPAAMPS